jgi:hypothetical protein
MLPINYELCEGCVQRNSAYSHAQTDSRFDYEIINLVSDQYVCGYWYALICVY